MSSSLSPSSLVESYDASNQVKNKKKKGKIKNKKDKQGTKSQPTTHSVESDGLPIETPCNRKFPYKICKGDHIIMDCHGLSKVLEVCS